VPSQNIGSSEASGSQPQPPIKKALPNPDEIKKQKDVYRMINAVNPNPILKNYIAECLKE
jgi:hypothetical protein